MRTIILTCIITLTCFPALAQEPDPTETPTNHLAPTEVVVDKKTNTVGIVVSGKTVGRFDENGLHVFGNISYEGTLADGTPPHLKKIEEGEQP